MKREHGEIVAWTTIPDGVRRPIRVSCKTRMRRLDLTGDRPLTFREARKLKRWWHRNLWSANLIKVSRNRFAVIALKEENIRV